MVLPERGGKQQQQQQQQQQLSHKESQWTRSERSVQESEMRRWRRKAPSISPSSASPLPAVLHARYAALGRAQRRRCATRATSRPRQAPPPLCTGGAATERPTPRCGGSSHTLPTLTPCLRPLAPRRPDTHSRPPSRSVGRSYPPHHLQGGAPQRHHRCSPHPVDWEMTVNAFSRIPELLYRVRRMSLLGPQSGD